METFSTQPTLACDKPFSRTINRFARITAVAVLSLLALVAGPSASAQNRGPAVLPPAASVAPAPVADTSAEAATRLNEGLDLERQQKWGEAYLLYDKATRQFPGSADLATRRRVARIHFDTQRRLSDTSFVEQYHLLDEKGAISLYGDLLSKVETFSATDPDWAGFVKQGGAHVEVALMKDDFRRTQLAGVTDEQIAGFLREFVPTIQRAQPRNRTETVEWASYAGRLIQARLGVAPQVAILEYACGAVTSLDEYSSYLTPGQYRDMFSQIDGEFVGLGVELQPLDDKLVIIRVIRGGPASRGGLLDGDAILSIDGVTVTSMGGNPAADRLRGEAGSTVRLAIEAKGGVVREVSIRREKVEIPSVDEVKMVDSQRGIGYFRVNSFQRNTVAEADAALWQLYRAGMRSLVLDLRGNPGGLLDAGVELADKFIDDGMIVSTRGRNPEETHEFKAHQDGTWRVPLVVLVDGDSASASEIFAAAIQDHARGAIVGEKSYGKGTVQGIFPLAGSQAGLRLTTSKFYSPNGRAIAYSGVTPSHLVAKQDALQVATSGTIDRPGLSGNPTNGAVVAARPAAGTMTTDPLANDAQLVAAVKLAAEPLAARP